MSCNQKTVLLAEDRKESRKLYLELLTVIRPYNLIEIVDGALVYDAVIKHQPDLIIMDVQLPNVSGIELTQKIKSEENLKQIPILTVSAMVLPEQLREIEASGCEDFLMKPFSVKGLLEKVDTLLGKIEPRALTQKEKAVREMGYPRGYEDFI